MLIFADGLCVQRYLKQNQMPHGYFNNSTIY